MGELKKRSARQAKPKKSDLVPIIISEMRSRLESAIKQAEEEREEAYRKIGLRKTSLAKKVEEKLSTLENRLREVVEEEGLTMREATSSVHFSFTGTWVGAPISTDDQEGSVVLLLPSYSSLPDSKLEKLGFGSEREEIKQLEEEHAALYNKVCHLENKLRSLDEKNIHIQAYVKRKELEETESGRELLSRVSDFADLYEKLGIDRSLLS